MRIEPVCGFGGRRNIPHQLRSRQHPYRGARGSYVLRAEAHMTYARARLWTGVAGVGALVVFALVMYLWQLPATLFPFDGGPLWAEWAALVTLFKIYVLISLPFDFLGGYWLPCKHQRLCLLFPTFWMKWARGVLIQGAVMTVCALVLFETGRRWGVWAAAGALAGLQLLLLAVQLPLAKWVGGLQSRPAEVPAATRPAVAVSGFDAGFAGGFAGIPGIEKLVIPKHWLDSLGPAAISAVLLRRAAVLATGARTRGLLLAMAWNLGGFVLCAHLPGAGVERLWEFVTTLLAMTLWSFLGLLLLPSLSRPAVFAADREALRAGADPQALSRAIAEIDQWQEDEPRRGRWLERVFHPVPSVENRVRALESGAPGNGAWHAARTALYLSWANFGMLSRAVHCNSGRPELWVMFPGD